MSDDLVKRLLAPIGEDRFTESPIYDSLCCEAAAEIERLSGDVEGYAETIRVLRLEIANQHVEITHWHDKFEAAAAALATAREALEFFADRDNWRRGRKLDPNSANFIGCIHARAALAPQIPEMIGRAILEAENA